MTPTLSKTQKRILRVGDRKGAKYSEDLAAMMTSIVESGGGNPNYGDRDSVGWRQERSHYGSVQERLNVEKGAGRFYTELKGTRGSKQSPGQKAQAVQRSAFPEKYDAVRAQAESLVKQWEKKGGRAQLKGTSRRAAGEPPKYFEGSDEFDSRAFILSNLGKPVKGRIKSTLASDYLEERQDPNSPFRTVTPGKVVAGKKGKKIEVKGAPKKGGKGGGKDGYSRKGGIYEVFHDPSGEYWDSGGIQKGAIGGHGGHVHVGADRGFIVQLGKRAEELGLTVGEHGRWGGTPTSGHTGGSFHYRNMGIDVSGDKGAMLKFAAEMRALAKKGRGK